jgi:hypothetical protein
MPEPTTRKGFLTVGRLILMFGFGGMGAFLHWFILPEESTASSATTRRASTDGSPTNGSAAVSASGKSNAARSTSLADILMQPYWERTDLIFAYIEGADAATTAELMQALTPELTATLKSPRNDFPRQWKAQLMLIFSHWATVDAPGMMSQVGALKLWPLTQMAFGLWSRTDWRSARASLSDADRKPLEWMTRREEAYENPNEVLAWIKANPKEATTQEVAMAALKGLFKRDPSAGLKETFEHMKHTGNYNFGWMVMPRFLKSNPELTLASLKEYVKYTGSGQQNYPVNHLWSSLMNSCPEHAVELTALYPPLQTQAWQLNAQNDPLGALVEARMLADPAQRTEAEKIALTVLSRTNPNRCLEEILQLPQAAQKEHLLSCVHALASAHPAEALAVAKKIPDEGSRSSALNSVASYWAEKHPNASLEEAVAFYPGAAGDVGFMSGLVRNLMYKDKAEALQLAAAATGEARDSSLSMVFRDLSHNNPRLLWENIALLPSGENRDEVLRNAVACPLDFATGKPSADAVLGRWNSLPEADRADTSSQVAQTIYPMDATAASAWVRDLPSGPARDAAAASLAASISRDRKGGAPDFDAAWQWASAIENPQQRYWALTSTISRWLPEDAASVTNVLQRSPLTEAEKAHLRAAYLLPTP